MTHDPIVSVADLTKQFRQDGRLFTALEGVTFGVSPGTFAVVVGKSGSGKTTLLNLIGGLDRPTGGHIEVDGRSLREMKDGTLSCYRNEKVGIVFQAFNLRNNDTALENVLTPFFFARGRHPEAAEKARESLAAVGLADFARQKAGTLSAGQRQRVALARAIVRDPILLLADEPTGNLDEETGSEVIGLIKHLNLEKHMTVVIATHDRGLTDAAGFVLTLKDGRPL